MAYKQTHIAVYEERMSLILSTLDRRYPIFVALVQCGRADGHNFHVIEQTYWLISLDFRRNAQR